MPSSVIYLYIYMYIYIYKCIYINVCIYIYMYIMSIYLSIYLSIWLSIYLFIFLYIYILQYWRVTGLSNLEKQPFADVLQNRFSWIFCNIHSKAPMSESLFNKVTKRKDSKETPIQVLYCKFCEIFKNSFF